MKAGPDIAEPQADLFPEVRSRPEDDPNSRYTPRPLIIELHREFRFTVDACSALDAPSSHVIGRFWSTLENGLEQSWRGERVWCNPPFDDLEKWIRKAWVSAAALVVMLIPANRTEQPFWATLVEPYRDRGWVPNEFASPLELRTRFLPTRARFGHPGNPEGVNAGSPEFGCVLLIFGRG